MVYEEIVELLENADGEWVSGEAIAAHLSITRAAVWKHIKKMQEEGYVLETQPRIGYRLSKTNDVLSKKRILEKLNHSERFRIDIQRVVTSTNDVAKDKAMHNEAEGFISISEYQTKGKGRKGRSFFCDKQSGIYMSTLLRPSGKLQDSMLITAAAAAAVYDGIKEVCHLESQIKWVNDVQIHGKKVCGILCEGSMEIDADGFEWIVLGIGINTQTAFPEELKDIAASIRDFTDFHFTRNDLIASVWNHFYEYYDHLEDRAFLDIYRKASCIIGHDINIYQGNNITQGHAKGIDDQGNLIVENENGTQHIFSGEVSVRTI